MNKLIRKVKHIICPNPYGRFCKKVRKLEDKLSKAWISFGNQEPPFEMQPIIACTTSGTMFFGRYDQGPSCVIDRNGKQWFVSDGRLLAWMPWPPHPLTILWRWIEQ